MHHGHEKEIIDLKIFMKRELFVFVSKKKHLPDLRLSWFICNIIPSKQSVLANFSKGWVLTLSLFLNNV